MTTKLLEVVVCTLCKHDRPAIATRTIDVCGTHDNMIAERELEAMYECEQCDRVFKDPTKLRNHVLRNHTDGADNVCPYCGKELMNEQGVKRHIGQKHKEEMAA